MAGPNQIRELSGKIAVSRVGVHVSHESGFTVDRPRGSGDFVFLHFTTAINLLSSSGRRREQPGTCILYAPPFPQWYCAAGDSFSHNWFHVSGTAVPALLKQYGIPLNTPFRPRDTGIIPAIVNDLFLEIGRSDRCQPRALALHVERLCIELLRGIDPAAVPGTKPGAAHADRLDELRRMIRQNPHKPWGVASLAQQAFLCRSRFTALYKQQFGMSPVEDIIHLRLERACWLLSGTRLSVKEIAAESGFEDACYFSRLFAKRMGLTPGRYRER
jgi:AraC family transcriptional regulator, arabinose operon regulatory protein